MSRFSEMIVAYSQKNDLSYRQISKDIGISPSTLTRFLQGKDLSLDCFMKLMNWMLETSSSKRRPPNKGE